MKANPEQNAASFVSIEYYWDLHIQTQPDGRQRLAIWPRTIAKVPPVSHILEILILSFERPPAGMPEAFLEVKLGFTEPFCSPSSLKKITSCAERAASTSPYSDP